MEQCVAHLDRAADAQYIQHLAQNPLYVHREMERGDPKSHLFIGLVCVYAHTWARRSENLEELALGDLTQVSHQTCQED